MNKISLSTWIFDRLPFDEAAKHVKNCGYKYIELSGYNWVDDIWTVEDVARACDREGLEVLSVHCNHHALHNKDYWTPQNYEAYHEKLYKSLRIFGSPMIVEHGMYQDSKQAHDTYRHLAYLKQLAKQTGIRLTFENVPGTIYRFPEQLEGLFDDELRFTFDVAHAAYLDIDPLAFEKFFPCMTNAHIYDVIPGVSLSDWAPLNTGLGKIDWKRFVAALKRAGYEGPYTIELNEDNLTKVLRICGMTAGREILPDAADRFAIYSREQMEELLKD